MAQQLQICKIDEWASLLLHLSLYGGSTQSPYRKETSFDGQSKGNSHILNKTIHWIEKMDPGPTSKNQIIFGVKLEHTLS